MPTSGVLFYSERKVGYVFAFVTQVEQKHPLTEQSFGFCIQAVINVQCNEIVYLRFF